MSSDPPEPLYYVSESEPLVVRKRPVTQKNPDGSQTISIGFPVCTAHEAVGPEGAKVIAAMLNLAGGKNDGR